MMSVQLITAPAIEPITVTEIKEHLRIETNTLEDDLTPYQSIAPGSHAIAAAYSLKGTGVDVLNKNVLVILEAGACGSGGSINVKLQESDTDVDANYTDVSGGSFDIVNESNDNDNYEIEYTGISQYLRVVATVAGAACEFGVSIIVQDLYGYEDTLLLGWITAARKWAEKYQNRAYITQTWELYLREFPNCDFIRMPWAPLQSIASLKYYETDETENTMSASYYHVDIKEEPGKIVLAYGQVWPTTTLRTVNGVIIQYIAGYGDAAADVPDETKLALKMIVGHFYENREMTLPQKLATIPLGVKSLLDIDSRNWF